MVQLLTWYPPKVGRVRLGVAPACALRFTIRFTVAFIMIHAVASIIPQKQNFAYNNFVGNNHSMSLRGGRFSPDEAIPFFAWRLLLPGLSARIGGQSVPLQ